MWAHTSDDIQAAAFLKLPRLLQGSIGYLYVITLDNETTKIGITRDVRRRLRQLGNQFDQARLKVLQVTVSLPLEDYTALERKVHRNVLEDDRSAGEYFFLSHEDAVKLVEACSPQLAEGNQVEAAIARDDVVVKGVDDALGHRMIDLHQRDPLFARGLLELLLRGVAA